MAGRALTICQAADDVIRTKIHMQVAFTALGTNPVLTNCQLAVAGANEMIY